MKNKGRTTGLEPANDGITTHCLNHLATIAFKTNYTGNKMDGKNKNKKYNIGLVGIEPTLKT